MVRVELVLKSRRDSRTQWPLRGPINHRPQGAGGGV